MSALWDCLREGQSYKSGIALVFLDWFVLALNLLYAISAIDYRDGIIYGEQTASLLNRKHAEDIQARDVSVPA